MLDQAQMLDLKLRLQKRAEQLREEIERTRAKALIENPGDVAERARDPHDDSFATLIVDTNLTEIERDVEELGMIDSALQRISAGTYGDCIDCGQSIPLPRLQAEPTAERCIKCQERFERTHVGGRTPSI